MSKPINVLFTWVQCASLCCTLAVSPRVESSRDAFKSLFEMK